MGLYRGSRLRFSDMLQVEDRDGDIHRVFVLQETTAAVPDGSLPYTVKARDTMESLAFKHYGDANKWYVIAWVNPQVFWPLDLEPGMLIYIPPKSYAASV